VGVGLVTFGMLVPPRTAVVTIAGSTVQAPLASTSALEVAA
jgi:hypothetical protein